MIMYRGGSSRIFPALLILVVIVVAIVALVAIGRSLLGGSGRSQPETSSARRALLTTDADHSIRMTVRGPIVADEDFRSYQVEISPVSRSLTTYKGYQQQTLDNRQLSNNTEAYTQFVYALDQANFLREATLSDEQNDTRGVCASGRLYTFDILEAQSSVKTLWTSSCQGAGGSFRGNAEEARALFLDQIPDSNTVLRSINLAL